MSAYDLKRCPSRVPFDYPSKSSRHGARAEIFIGSSTVVTRQWGRHAATRWKRTAGGGSAQGAPSADRNSLQDHFIMVGGQESARSLLHLAELFRLADKAHVLHDPDLAASRMTKLLATHGLA